MSAQIEYREFQKVFSSLLPTKARIEAGVFDAKACSDVQEYMETIQLASAKQRERHKEEEQNKLSKQAADSLYRSIDGFLTSNKEIWRGASSQRDWVSKEFLKSGIACKVFAAHDQVRFLKGCVLKWARPLARPYALYRPY
jgi:hypothetical protein